MVGIPTLSPGLHRGFLHPRPGRATMDVRDRAWSQFVSMCTVSIRVVPCGARQRNTFQGVAATANVATMGRPHIGPATFHGRHTHGPSLFLLRLGPCRAPREGCLLEDQSPLQLLDAAIEAYLRATGSLHEGGWVAGWVFAASTARVTAEGDVLPLCTGATYSIGPQTSYAEANGLSHFLVTVHDRATWQMIAAGEGGEG